jgi:hypothetical protein
MPLPEESIICHGSALLIDFDSDDHDAKTYRSPPFREVHSSDLELDDHSPLPLPVPPRSYHQDDDYDSVTGRKQDNCFSAAVGAMFVSHDSEFKMDLENFELQLPLSF